MLIHVEVLLLQMNASMAKALLVTSHTHTHTHAHVHAHTHSHTRTHAHTCDFLLLLNSHIHTSTNLHAPPATSSFVFLSSSCLTLFHETCETCTGKPDNMHDKEEWRNAQTYSIIKICNEGLALFYCHGWINFVLMSQNHSSPSAMLSILGEWEHPTAWL